MHDPLSNAQVEVPEEVFKGLVFVLSLMNSLLWLDWSHGRRDPNYQDKCDLKVDEFRDRPARAVLFTHSIVTTPSLTTCVG